jgi:hypothetical protein
VSPITFDHVVLVDATGLRRSYSAEQFLSLPLDVRIQHILSRDIEFFRGATRLERGEALKSLRGSVTPGARSSK